MEIERKYRIDRFPGEEEGWPLVKEAVVCQGYIATSPTVRIRAAEARRPERRTTYTLTFKGEGTLVRQEIELPLEEATFLQLRELLPAPMIRKDYRVYAARRPPAGVQPGRRGGTGRVLLRGGGIRVGGGIGGVCPSRVSRPGGDGGSVFPHE